MNLFQKSAAAMNRFLVEPLMGVPILSRALGRSMTVLTYTGRTSGKTFSLPVMYRRAGEQIIVGVAMPDRKNWWRNFSGEGGPITATLDGTEHTGHAVSRRNAKGQVSVTISLTD